MTPKTKMLWDISKEQEKKVLNGEDIDLEELAGLFKMIRSAEYRRGKEEQSAQKGEEKPKDQWDEGRI